MKTASTLLALTVLGASSMAPAASLLQTLNHPEPQAGSGFGGTVAGIVDFDGDGLPDLAVAAVQQTVAANTQQGRIYLFSSADGSHIGTLDNPNPQSSSGFGFAIDDMGDLDGDGVADIGVGAYLQDVGGNVDQGQVSLFSGADGSLIQTLDDPDAESQSLFGHRLDSIGDVDGDGVRDLAVGAIHQRFGALSTAGAVFVFSGADRSFLYRIDNPQPQNNVGFALDTDPVGDIDGDTVSDLGVCAHRQDSFRGRCWVFSGVDGALRLQLDNPSLSGGQLGDAIEGIGDVNGDFIPDIAAGAGFQRVGGNGNQGQAFIFSGADGSLLVTMNNPNPQSGGVFGRGLVGLGDVDGDGFPDLASAAVFQDVAGVHDAGEVAILSGVDGTLLEVLTSPVLVANGHFARLGRTAPIANSGLPLLAIGAEGQQQVFVFATVPDVDADGIENEIDLAPLTESKDFSDLNQGGVTSGRVGNADAGITFEIFDAPGAGVGVRVFGTSGVARIRLDGSKGVSKLAPGDYILTSGNSFTLEVLSGRAEVEFVIDGETISVVIEDGTVFFDELIEGDELLQLDIAVLDGSATVNGLVTLNAGDTVSLPLEASIDVKPTSSSNPINPFARGKVPVALLGRTDFDVQDVDPLSLGFGPGKSAPAHDLTNPGTLAGHMIDVNADGLVDLLGHYGTLGSQIAVGDTEACLTGESGGLLFRGCDAIATRPPSCGLGFEFAVLVPLLLSAGIPSRWRRGGGNRERVATG